MEQSRLLDSIGTAEMEREVQKKVITALKKTSAAMVDESGIEPSMTDDEIKDYMEFVMNELSKKVT